MSAAFVRVHTLTLTREGEGTLVRTPEAAVYDAGSVVVVTATPAEGWYFDHWTGYGIPSGQETNPEVHIYMDGDKSLKAVFLPWSTLTLDTQGHGEVLAYTGGTPTTNLDFPIEDDFNDLDATDWNTVAGGWEADEGYLTPIGPAAASRAWKALAAADTDTWLTYAFPAAVSGDSAEYALRADPVTGHRLYLKLTPGAVQLVQDTGTAAVLAEAAATAAPGERYELHVLAQGSAVRVWRGTRMGVMEPLFECATCTVTASDRIELASGAGTDVRFDNLRVMTFNEYVLFPPVARFKGSRTFTVEALPAPRWEFSDWVGNMAGSSLQMTVTVSGNAVLTGGFERPQATITMQNADGGTVEPAAGAYTFDKSDPVRIKAIPDGNHTFDYWDSPIDVRADPYKAGTTIRPKENLTVAPLYSMRMGVGAIDTVVDMTFFLGVINQAAAIYNDYTVDQFDCNNIQYDADIKPIYCPNGMPDVAELFLIERIVKMGRTGLTAQSGVGGEATWNAWSTNLAQAQLDLPGQNIRLQRIVAGYMTLGNYDSIRLVERLVRVTFGVELTEAAYDREQQNFLKPDKDADNDGVLNIEEWQQASPDGDLAYLTAFADAALDGHAPPASGTTSAFAAQALSILDFGFSCGCENYACMATGNVIPDAYPGPGEEYPLTLFNPDPWGTAWNNQCEANPNGPGIPLGTEIQVTATADSGKGFAFAGWLASGTMLDGSRNKKDKFTLTNLGDTKPLAIFGASRTRIPDDTSPDPSYKVEIDPPENAHVETEASGVRYVYAPPNSALGISVASTGKDRLYEPYGIEENPGSIARTYSSDTSVTFPIGQEVIPLLRSVLDQPLPVVSVQLRASEGGKVLGCDSYGHSASFLEKVVLLEHAAGLSLAAVPNPGYEFVRWTTPGLEGQPWHVEYVSVDQVQSAEAQFRPVEQYELTLKVELAKDSDGDKACAGYIIPYPATRYYIKDTEVFLTANTQPGYVHVGWKTDETDATGKPKDELLAPGPHPVMMDRSLTVTAVFAKMKALVVNATEPGSLFLAAPYLKMLGYDPIEPPEPNREKVLEALKDPACVVFAWGGHGNSEEILLQYKEEEQILHHWDPAWDLLVLNCSDVASVSHSGQKLVYLLGCNLMDTDNGSNWQIAFGAECVVGWHGHLFMPNISNEFDSVFWASMGQGKTAAEAIDDAKVVLRNRPQYKDNESTMYPTYVGDRDLRLKICP